MNRRMHPRVDVFGRNIEVSILTKEGIRYTGTVKDLSQTGISFYSFDYFTGVAVISFVYKHTPVTFEVEILRDKLSLHGTQYSGRFRGVPSVLKPLLANPSMVQKKAVLI